MCTWLNLIAILTAILCVDSINAAEPVDLGSRRELFADEAFIERLTGKAELRLHHPTPREVAMTFEKPWEGKCQRIRDGDPGRRVIPYVLPRSSVYHRPAAVATGSA
jgi:hypothetical protein